MKNINLFCSFDYKRKHSLSETFISGISHFLYLGGAKVTFIKGNEVRVKNNKMVWYVIALKITAFIVLFPLTLVLVPIHLQQRLKLQHDKNFLKRNKQKVISKKSIEKSELKPKKIIKIPNKDKEIPRESSSKSLSTLIPKNEKTSINAPKVEINIKMDEISASLKQQPVNATPIEVQQVEKHVSGKDTNIASKIGFTSVDETTHLSSTNVSGISQANTQGIYEYPKTNQYITFRASDRTMSDTQALSQIFAYLSPNDLIPASLVSHLWRHHTSAEKFLVGECLLRTEGLTTPLLIKGFGTLPKVDFSFEQTKIIRKANNLGCEVWCKNGMGEIIRCNADQYNYRLHKRQAYAETFDSELGTVVIWPNGQSVQLSKETIGSGMSKTVHIAYDVRSSLTYVAACTREAECDPVVYAMLKGKRGIAQIHNYMFGEFNEFAPSKNRHFFYGQRYDTDLEMHLTKCSLEDLQVIVKDLVYAIIALEGDDPQGDWILHGDIKDANVFLKIDDKTKRVLGAYLGDFGLATIRKTRVVDRETLKREIEEFGEPKFSTRKTQRKFFMGSLFHQINKYCQKKLKNKTSLSDLCKGDLLCEAFMKELEKKYGWILERRYFHMKD